MLYFIVHRFLHPILTFSYSCLTLFTLSHTPSLSSFLSFFLHWYEGTNNENVNSNIQNQNIYAGTQVPAKSTINDLATLVHAINNDVGNNCLAGTTQIRKLLSIQDDPPIQQIVDAGVLPRLVQFLASTHSQLQFEAAWALTNIASGNAKQTRAVIESNAVPSFVQLLRSPHEDVKEQAIWALGNIAGDSNNECRDLVLQAGALQPLIEMCHPNANTRLAMLRNATWVMSNFCRGKPQPNFDAIRACVPTLVQLLHSKDEEVLTDACWALSYVSDDNTNNNVKIQAVLEAGAAPRLVQLLVHKSDKIQTPALRTLGNIVTGNNDQTQCVLQNGLLPNLLALLTHPKKTIRKETCWTLSNVTAGTKEQIQLVIQSNFIPMLLEVMRNDEYEVQREVTWALSNITSEGTPEQIDFLVRQGFFPPICNLLLCPDAKLVLLILDSIENVLKLGEAEMRKNGNTTLNPICEIIEECGGLDHIENLQRHDNNEVYEKVIHILKEYFGSDEEVDDTELAPTVDNTNNQFTFGTGPPKQAPTGGFVFNFN